MFELHQWMILFLVAAFVAQDTTAGPQALFSEPLVSGPIVGWLLGDLRLGLIIGVATQLIWSGAVPAGSSSFLDSNVAAVCAVAVALMSGGTPIAMAVSLAWLIPVGLLGSGLTAANRRLNGRLVASVQPQTDRGRLIAARHLTGWALAGVRGMVTLGMGVAFGAVIVPWLTIRIAPHVNPALIWAGIFGAGTGVALGVTWRYSHGKAALLGALGALGLWLLGTRPGW